MKSTQAVGPAVAVSSVAVAALAQNERSCSSPSEREWMDADVPLVKLPSYTEPFWKQGTLFCLRKYR